MLTRARAKATNQHVFVDDKWNDAYIQTKDEQIEMLHSQRVLKSWEDDADSEAEEEAARVAAALVDGEDPADEDEDRWVSESDTEDEEDDEERKQQGVEDAEAARRAERLRRSRDGAWLAGGGLLENVLWTAATVAVAPVVLYAAVARCKRRHKTKSKNAWPLESRSLSGFLLKTVTNVATLAILLLATGYGVCGGGSLIVNFGGSQSSLFHWRSLLREWNRLDTCAATFSGDWRDVVSSVSASGVASAGALPSPRLAVQTALLVAAAFLIARFHRLWLKSVVLLTAVSLLSVRVASDLRAEKRSAIEVLALDPSFAFANESIFIAVDGQNLEQGATIAWIPYWGSEGLQQRKAFEIAKLFSQPLRNGGVHVAFDQLNEFVPCYATRANDRDFKCFEHLRLRVKDQKSVPGWSLHAHSEL